MANLYKIANLCCDTYLVEADNEALAVIKYQAWVETMEVNPEDYAVAEVALYASDSGSLIFIP